MSAQKSFLLKDKKAQIFPARCYKFLYDTGRLELLEDVGD